MGSGPQILSEKDLQPSVQPLSNDSIGYSGGGQPKKEANMLDYLGGGKGAKDDIHEKENLISQIRERDETIARLLGEVREKRATRLHEIEGLADRMDHLEARLLSG